MPPRVISTPLDFAADADAAGQEALFEKIAAEFAAPLARLARAHEADLHLQQDLLQEIHVALWRSLAAFGGRCSLRTWVYRVAHNVAATHVLRNRRRPGAPPHDPR
jgi:RNA polymerase sigma-70 factor (ECF subfamily)